MISRLRFEVGTFQIQSRITVYLIRTFDSTYMGEHFITCRWRHRFQISQLLHVLGLFK